MNTKTYYDLAIEKYQDDINPYEDYFSLCKNEKNHDWNHELREKVIKSIVRISNYPMPDYDLMMKFNNLLYKSLLFGAPYYFDDYLQVVEWGKKYDDKFYAPRRHYLKRYVDAYQKILDKELDFLSISMPKRCGKSQMGINFTCMISGREPNKATLMEGTGDALVDSFYKGCLEYLQQPNVYHFYDIFPESPLVQTNADTKIINLVDKSRFPTIMCRSIDARQVGLSEATNLLYLDDCVEGREEAKNRARLDMKWETLSGDVIGRALEGTPIVICGTRYSIYDPIGHLQEEMEKQGKRMMVLETPALDSVTDESNFEFIKEGQKQFSTQYFKDQREMLTAEQWESEFQQQPFEAKGILFPPKSLNYYYELPIDVEPDAVVAVCDPADCGEDSTAMVILKIYGEDIFVDDLVFDDAPPEVTKPECAKKIIENNATTAIFESNNSGQYYSRDVNTLVESYGGKVSIRTKRSVSNKQTRIEFASDGIIKHFYFKDSSRYARNSQYARFMKELTSYTRSGKVPHDDAPDVLSLAENQVRVLTGSKVEVMKRIF